MEKIDNLPNSTIAVGDIVITNKSLIACEKVAKRLIKNKNIIEYLNGVFQKKKLIGYV